MKTMPFHKYRPYPAIDLPNRTWPGRTITQAPRWCSVDLRDGNQALVMPMGLDEKKDMFLMLTEMGFKEIEVGFPSASQTEYDFMRLLIEQNLIPEDVTIQVLTQAREHLIKKSFEALRGTRKAIVHLYNSTSELQRRVVFNMSKQEIVDLAIKAARLIKEEAEKMPDTVITLEYSPESFTGTEPDFAIEICEAVMDEWKPSANNKIILNIPSTVEMSTPNVYADSVEYFGSKIKNRENVVLSVHAHNDRGTAVAATELAMLAGADRVEGTLFGNGERTGNVDILTLALNLFSQGIDPNLDFSDIDRIAAMSARCTRIPVHVRHPYAGELVYTAFSGSHQDAINKGMKALANRSDFWEVPYLPIDPADVGRTYESVIRINSQSGKGGVAYIMEAEFGLKLPKEMHAEFGRIIQNISDKTGGEVNPSAIWDAFENEYLAGKEYSLAKCKINQNSINGSVCAVEVDAIVRVSDADKEIKGNGNGPIDAFSNALRDQIGCDFKLTSYYEHALDRGSDSRAAAFIKIEGANKQAWGVGIDTNIDRASFKAILSALNRLKM